MQRFKSWKEGGDMKKAKNKTAHAIKSIAERMANMACGSASAWGMYQPKEPKKLDKSKKWLRILLSPLMFILVTIGV